MPHLYGAIVWYGRILPTDEILVLADRLGLLSVEARKDEDAIDNAIEKIIDALSWHDLGWHVTDTNGDDIIGVGVELFNISRDDRPCYREDASILPKSSRDAFEKWTDNMRRTIKEMPNHPAKAISMSAGEHVPILSLILEWVQGSMDDHWHIYTVLDFDD